MDVSIDVHTYTYTYTYREKTDLEMRRSIMRGASRSTSAVMNSSTTCFRCFVVCGLCEAEEGVVVFWGVVFVYGFGIYM